MYIQNAKNQAWKNLEFWYVFFFFSSLYSLRATSSSADCWCHLQLYYHMRYLTRVALVNILPWRHFRCRPEREIVTWIKLLMIKTSAGRIMNNAAIRMRCKAGRAAVSDVRRAPLRVTRTVCVAVSWGVSLGRAYLQVLFFYPVTFWL